MKIKFDKKTKITIIIVIFIIMCIFISMFLKKPEKNKNEDNNYIEEENVVSIEETEEENSKITNEENNTLQKDTNTSTYFTLKQCMELYYNSQKIKSNFRIIDNEALESLGITEDNAPKLIGNIETPKFSIDDIYRQKIDTNKSFYVVYHRLETSENSYKNSIIIIKIDKENNIFSIYPYEFLEKNKLTNLKEKDHIELDKNLENRAVNYFSKINLNNAEITRELYEKFKFDLQKDLSHLYNSLNETYKNKKFQDFEDFKKYLKENESAFTNDVIERYTSNKYSKYVEYVAIGKNRNYIFIVKNIMNFSCLLDTYTIGTPYYLSLYNSILPNNQAAYCLDRAIAAINDKNYKFVYEKIDLSKKQALGSYDNFVKYINSIFYNKTEYKIEDYQAIGENVCYEFTILLDDKEQPQDLKRQIKIKIILQDDIDFIIMIDEK